jgi:hypothetical protein
MDFETYWKQFAKKINFNGYPVKLIAETAWDAARKEDLKLIDEILNSEGSYVYYKKNPDLV